MSQLTVEMVWLEPLLKNVKRIDVQCFHLPLHVIKTYNIFKFYYLSLSSYNIYYLGDKINQVEGDQIYVNSVH